MNCTKYMELSEVERQIYDTELLHCCRSSDMLFEAGRKLIERGRKKKLFDTTIIRPVTKIHIEDIKEIKTD